MTTATRRRASSAQVARRGGFPDLATYCAKTGDTQVNIAAATGTTQSHISRILNGEVIPRAGLASRIARYARIPLESFTRVYLAKHQGQVSA